MNTRLRQSWQLLRESLWFVPGLLVLGGRMRRVEDLDLRLLGVAVSRHGALIDTGAGAAALGNPARCVAWLANKLGSFGAGLRAGDVVLPGAVIESEVIIAAGAVVAGRCESYGVYGGVPARRLKDFAPALERSTA